MGMILRLIGGLVLVLSFAWIALIAISGAIGGAGTAEHGGGAAARGLLGGLLGAGAGIVAAAGGLLLGTVLYVGGRALQRMSSADRREAFERRRLRKRSKHSRLRGARPS